MQNKKVDKFTLDIVKDSLKAIGDEMFVALQRTSMSTIIYEVLDYACAISSAKGELLAQGNGVTGFIGMLSFMVKDTIKKFNDGKDLYEGDVIIVNDPYGGGGSHLSDVGFVLPIFYEGELIAFSANKAHWPEVGGKDFGSFTNDAIDVFQEGLQFPFVKLYDRGNLNEPLIEIIKANVRLPEGSLGDLHSQVASLKTGEKRIHELCKKYGLDVVKSSINYLLDHGEKISRNELKKLPKGTFEGLDYVEIDGLGNGPFPIKVKVTISDDAFICDFRGSSPPVPGGVNCSFTSLSCAVRTIFMAMTNPSQDVNDGAFRPIEILVDEDSILNAKRPVPVSNYFESLLMASDVVWQAVAPFLPNRLSAGHLLSVCACVIVGLHQDSKDPFVIVEPSAGGWGASLGQDGASAQFCVADGETYNVPVEICETRYGVMVDEYSLNPEGKGAGEYNGGYGTIRAYKAMNEGETTSCTFGRNKFKTWGLNSGHDGSHNRFEIVKKNGEKEGPFGYYARYPLAKGDVLRLYTATGGGYGDPLNRKAESVVKDVRNGYFTKEEASEIFGVDVDTDKWTYVEKEVRKKV